jgi:hypothetical protein
MSNVNQLLSKALSTASEDEAMACLRMARKKGGSIEESTSSGDYNGHDAKYWYDKAYIWYTQAKAVQTKGMSAEQQKHLYQMYQTEAESVIRLRAEKRKLEHENEKLKLKKELPKWHAPLMSLQFLMIILLLALNTIQSADFGVESTQGDKHELEFVPR